MSIKKINGEWHVDIQPGGRGKKRWRVKFKMLSKANKFIHEKHVNELSNPSYNIIKKDIRTLRDLADAWYKLHGNTLKDGELRYSKTRYLCGLLGDPPAFKFTKVDYLEFRLKRLRTVGRNTVNHDLTYLKAMFKKLIKLENWHLNNPLEGIEKLTIDEAEITYLSEKEMQSLKNYLTGDVLAVVSICLSTGSRWSEAQELRGEQIRNCKIQFAATKNSKSRLIPITEEENALIFEGRKSRGRLFKECKNSFKSALDFLEIILPRGQLTHVLRHSYSVHFMLNRGHFLDLQKMLGHKTVNQTIRYAQFHPDYLQDALTKNPWQNLN